MSAEHFHQLAHPAKAKNQIKTLTVQIHLQTTPRKPRRDSMQGILAIGEQYLQFPDVERSFCHAISNVSMKADYAKLLIELKAHEKVCRVLMAYIGIDWKVCWLGCSALWNLARPQDTREAFTIEIIDLVLRAIRTHGSQCKLINTALGALSNLSLNDSLKTYVGTYHNIKSILESLREHFQDRHVACTGCGLIANLAVDDELANRLVEFDCIKLITDIAETHYTIFQSGHSNFRKNLIASLSNMSTSRHYKKHCVEHCAIDLLYSCLEDFQDNVELENLIHSALEALGLQEDFSTSLHVACKEGMLPPMKNIVDRRTDQILFEKDSSGLLPIDLAATNDHFQIVQFLISIGSPHPCELKSSNLEKAVLGGVEEINVRNQSYAKVVTSSSMLTHDPALMICSYCSPYELFMSGETLN